MFTNWLTGTSGGSNANANGNSNTNNNNNNNNINNSVNNNSTNTHEERVRNSIASLALPPSTPSGIMSTPPDVALEVGPTPSVRFVAHSIVLGMHSGYLRSAIRLDEQHQQQQQQQQNANVAAGGAAGAAMTTLTAHHHQHAANEFVLYLSNVTAEQFAPLLTYMYTGYLDLNVENIFGVLLATHVLHMPRALEICRSFLARAQTEGYFNNNLPSIPTSSTSSNSNSNNNNTTNPNSNNAQKHNGKIIRPIPSKATLPNFGFLPAHLPLQQQQQQTQLSVNNNNTATAINCFKSLQQQLAYAGAGSGGPLLIEQMRLAEHQQQQQQQQHKEIVENKLHEPDRGEEIVVDNSNSPRSDVLRINETEDDDEEVEVYIDSLSETENELEHERMRRRKEADSDDEHVIVVTNDEDTLQQTQKQKPTLPQQITQKSTNKSTSNKQQQRNNSKGNNNTQQQKREKRTRRNGRQHANSSSRNTSTSSGLQVAKAPIPASQLDMGEASKVILDVASCDGPVRFRRILNTAYGHKPDAYAPTIPERTQQSVSLSFHQQMAKTISQQRQLQHAEESENSESSGGGGPTHGNAGKQGSKSAGATTSNEIYVCVYCKHSFKSQYCYQKHAKRHLNPLSLNCVRGAGHSSNNNNNNTHNTDRNVLPQCYSKLNVDLPAAHTTALPLPLVTTTSTTATGKQNTTDLLRREVRPLDMNVQYYPCKTCGSKFPSYYFVHKHRKLCHADEEANEAANGRGRETTERTKATATSDDEKPDDIVVEDITRNESNKSNE